MDIEQKRSAVIALFLAGKRQKDIVRELSTIPVCRSFVHRTVKRYLETGSTKKRHGGGRQATVVTPAMVKIVKKRLKRNPRRSATKLAKDLNISDRSLRRILKDKLQTKPYKIQKVQDLSMRQKQERVKRAKALLQRAAEGRLENIVFTDEKLFTVEQFVNKQNDRVWLPARSRTHADVLTATRRQKSASVMVWAGITRDGRTPLVFVPEGVKINQNTYRELVLQNVVEPWARHHFGSRGWVFQQDSAPAHKAKKTQLWIAEHFPGFISSSEWPASSPDLNPMDFAVWSMLEAEVCSKKHESLEALKRHLTAAWDKIPQEHLRASYDAFLDRLRRVVKLKGEQVELYQ